MATPSRKTARYGMSVNCHSPTSKNATTKSSVFNFWLIGSSFSVPVIIACNEQFLPNQESKHFPIRDWRTSLVVEVVFSH